jgi:hypothetical protein
VLYRDRESRSQKPRTASLQFSVSLFCALFLITGCTTISVSKIDRTSTPITLLCIEENPRSEVADLLSFLEHSFQSYGIRTAVYRQNSVPATCEYSLWYNSTEGWDIGYYLNFAEIRVRRGAETVATATYHHGGGFGFNKWQSTETKLTPVVEELLADFRSQAKPL